jgi:DNA-binding beta-propeller fold protein YncE
MKNLIVLIISLFILYVNGYTQIDKDFFISGYIIGDKIHLEGDGGWDLITVDESTNRLYVSHGTISQVVDLSTNKLIATIPDTKGVHGIIPVNEFNKGFISCGRDTSVLVFDLKTFEVTARIKVTGENPDVILYDPFTKRVFAFNGKTANCTVIDARTNEIIETIPFDGKPEFASTDGSGKIYVNIEDKNLLTEIDSKKMKVIRSWSIAPGEEPSGLALDNENHLLFSACSNKLMVISDAIEGKVITTLPIGDRCDGVAFDTELKRAFSSNGEGTITVVQEYEKNDIEIFDNITSQIGARTIAVNSKTHHLYLPTAEYDPAPEPTPENPKPRPKIKPNSFIILDFTPMGR